MIIWNKKNNGIEAERKGGTLTLNFFFQENRDGWRENGEMNENKRKKTLDNFLAMNSSSQSPNDQDNRELPMPSQQIRGRKKVKSNRTAVYRELLATRRELREKEKEIEKYRKRLQRSKDRIPLQNVSTKSKLISNYAETCSYE